MTITLTSDWLIYIYMLLENLFYIYVQEMKVRNYYAYFEQLTDIDIDCSQLPEFVETLSSPIISEMPILTEPKYQVELSELDERAVDLWDEIQNEIRLEDESDTFIFENDLIRLDDGAEEVNEDCIYLQDIEEETILELTGYEAFASAKIADNVDGPQQWVVSVIGMEEEYIHVTDGRRIWVNIGNQVSKIRNNDVLALDVIRSEKNIEVTKVFRLDVGMEVDYMIPDESYHNDSYELAM